MPKSVNVVTSREGLQAPKKKDKAFDESRSEVEQEIEETMLRDKLGRELTGEEKEELKQIREGVDKQIKSEEKKQYSVGIIKSVNKFIEREQRKAEIRKRLQDAANDSDKAQELYDEELDELTGT